MGNYRVQKESAEKYSLRGRVFSTIRENILNGKYKQNEELKETAIGEELGVSRTPVREALRQLELEGLVKIIPNRGAFVNGITAKDVEDIYMIRSLLEGLCARWATAYITKEQLEELEEVLFLSEFHMQKNHFEQLPELDNKFHEILYDASQSKILDHVLSDFHHYVERVRKVALSSKERACKCSEEHRLILEAIKEKDAKRAEELANIHMMNSIRNLGDYGLEHLLTETE